MWQGQLFNEAIGRKIHCVPKKSKEGKQEEEKSRSNCSKMDAGAANTGTTLSLGVWFNPPSKQKEEVALCDWLAGTSCL